MMSSFFMLKIVWNLEYTYKKNKDKMDKNIKSEIIRLTT